MALVEVRGLTKDFARPGPLFGPAPIVRAVDGVSFDIERGETLGLVGESGSGKTTTGRCVLRLIEPTAGEVRYDGTNVMSLSAGELRRLRRHMQIVFQDPYSSLNPRMRAGDIVEEPLIVHRVGDRDSRRARVREMFELVGLDPGLGARRPADFSGGQRQRIGIARALALNPSFVVADEPVSSLDAPVQAQVVGLFVDLQRKLGLTYLFIAHDLRLVERICTRVAVMYGGRIVEIGDAGAIFRAPRHPYTKALLSAAPVPDPDARRQRIVLDADAFDRTSPLREIAPGHMAAI